MLMINEGRKSLKMVPCGGCGAKNFISSDLPPFETVPCNKCGHPVMIAMKLRQFELRAVIGLGGMARVFRAFDTTLHRDVAVKLMKPELAANPGSTEAFIGEARACAGLNHTNIIHVYTFDEYEGYKYLVMELADQGSMDQWIKHYTRLQELQVLDIGIKVASALDAAHRHNLLHLDVKPLNILFNSDTPPEPKLIDFGAGKKADHEEESDAIDGSPHYLAPERMSGHQDFRSDMYSLGATLYEGVTGQVPFNAEDINDVAMAHVNTPLTPPIQVNPEISEETNEAIVRAMAKNPDERFQSYDEFRMALEAARSHLLIRKYNMPQD